MEYWKKHSSVHRTLQPQKMGIWPPLLVAFTPYITFLSPKPPACGTFYYEFYGRTLQVPRLITLHDMCITQQMHSWNLRKLPMSSVTSRDLMVLLIVKKKLPGPLLHGLIWYLSISLQMKDRTRSEQPHKQKSAEFLCVLSVLLTAVSPSQFMRRCVNDTHTPKPSIQFLLNAQWSKFSTNKYILHWRWTVFALHLCLT